MSDLRVTVRNAAFQQWRALLDNRAKRQRRGELLVQGVRPITTAVRYGWPIRTVIYDADARLSRWAVETLDRLAAPRVAMATELIAELGGKAEPPELLAVAAMPPDHLSRIRTDPAIRVVVLDRPASPGNIGTVVRSADAFGAAGVVVTGHAADIYDPQVVRASTGSLFAVPVVRAPSHREVLGWVEAVRAGGVALAVVGTDEHGTVEIAEHDLTGPCLLVIGNEADGLSGAWRDACDVLARIPMAGAGDAGEGSASSLNAATAASIVLYESTRQRAAGAQRQ